MEQLHVMTHFGDVQPFLDENQDIAPRIAYHLRERSSRRISDSGNRRILASEADRKNLMMELALVDAGAPFVKATYNLEGMDC